MHRTGKRRCVFWQVSLVVRQEALYKVRNKENIMNREIAEKIAKELNITDQDFERRKKFLQIEDEDIKRIQKFKKKVGKIPTSYPIHSQVQVRISRMNRKSKRNLPYSCYRNWL